MILINDWNYVLNDEIVIFMIFEWLENVVLNLMTTLYVTIHNKNSY